MIKHNNIIEFLKGVEVEWKTLGEVAEVGTGNANRQDEDEHGQYPFYVRSKNILKSKKFQFDETAIVIPGEGGIGDIFHYIEGKYALHQRAYRIHVFSNKLNTKYLYYLMCDKFKQYILTKCVGATSISIRKPMLEQFQIPIPPLHVQTEIVRILDIFTALTADLTSELAVRRKQYNYYRDQLLTFKEDEVEWKALGEICTIGDGLHGTPNYDNSGDYYFINGNNLNNGKIIFNNNTKKVDDITFKKSNKIFTVENTVFLSINGTIGNVSLFNNEKIVLGKSVAYFRIRSKNLSVKFLFYFLQTGYAQKYYETQKTGSTIKNLSLKALREFKIPIPPLKEQTRIVEILDKFDALTNSITEGLPREIELRQKQYEYYRNLLLDFPKAEQ